MSKILKKLNGVTNAREQKYTLALKTQDDAAGPVEQQQPQQTQQAQQPQPPPQAEQPEQQKPESSPESSQDALYRMDHNVVIMDKNVWYLSMICIAFMGFIALILSVKAFTQIQKGNTNIMKLSKVILKQKADIANLNAVVRSTMNGKTGLSQGSPDQVQQVIRNMDRFDAEVSNLKKDYNRLIGKLVDLNDQVNTLKMEKAAKK